MTDANTPRTAAELHGRVTTCAEHGSAAEIWPDGSMGCLHCCQVETSCDCTEASAPIPAEPLDLLEAASEMLLWIDTYDDAMGHGYCAMQSGDYTDSCTCGFDEKHARWQGAIVAAARPGTPASAEQPSPSPDTPRREPDEWERTGHGAIKRHYPRLLGAIAGFLGGPSRTVCDADGCHVPMILVNGRWEAEAARLAASPSPEPEGIPSSDSEAWNEKDGHRARLPGPEEK